ncbi:hypothetical protein AB9_153 [Acinetobacter phage vB_AbaM_B9]|nr:hypothetical protein AB9_153 [Acinetobacter phage vB_AbaM_B9]
MLELDENEVIKVLTRNAIKCLVCNTILESKHRHHYSQCHCDNEAATDGGLSYQRYMAKDLDLVENLCEYAEMTRGEHYKQLEQQKLAEQIKLQERIDKGEMINVGNDVNPHWVSKEVWGIVMSVSDKYYPNAKKRGDK